LKAIRGIEKVSAIHEKGSGVLRFAREGSFFEEKRPSSGTVEGRRKSL